MNQRLQKPQLGPNRFTRLGDAPIPQLLFRLSLPSAFGLLSLTFCQLIDTVFIGRLIGSYGIGGIAVAMPIVLFFASFGRGLGVGAASIIARGIGAGRFRHVRNTLCLATLLWFFIAFFLLLFGLAFDEPLLLLFGGAGELLSYGRDYYLLLLPGLPFLGFAMLGNSVIRAEGKAVKAMTVLIISGVVNVLLDPVFIIIFDWGMKGAAAASTLAYMSAAIFAGYHFLSDHRLWRLYGHRIVGDMETIRAILSIGASPMLCQFLTALLALVMNRSLLNFGGDIAVASYGIVQRLYLFLLFPIIGLNQGFIPICGYNIGAGALKRVYRLLLCAMQVNIVIGGLIAIVLFLFGRHLAAVFTADHQLIDLSSFGISMVIMLLPLVGIQATCSVYFQVLGHPLTTLTLALLRQGLILIPLVLILPRFLGINGIWYAFPLSQFIACVISVAIMVPEFRRLKPQPEGVSRLR